ncbi:hypothetical protein C6P43_003674 [Kluyveromyces marxianus]|nr:hypothetical protein C6P43_003674 [Kluyveromyces marxianus]
MTKGSYLEISANKRQERDSKLFPEWLIPEDKLPGADVKNVLAWPVTSGFLSLEEIEITESSALLILESVKNRKWTAYQVALAFCHRASIAHQLVNCLSEVFFAEGLAQAKELDAYYEETGELKGPMHGLPISLKDNLNVIGQQTTLGFAGFCNNPEKFTYDSSLVSILRRMGAVFCFKTNVPTAMMMPETINHVFGETSNPFNRNLTCGGSSGGESALGALLGNCYLGIGSDIGGSLRIPASMQNLFTLRPTFGRFPTFGARSGLPGLESVNSVNGPISTNLDNLEFYCKTVVNEGKPWMHDPKCYEIPWKEVTLPKKLTFAVMKDDGYVKPYPGVVRGLESVISKLEKEGHEVIEWNPLNHDRLNEILLQMFVSDGGIHCKEYAGLTDEPFFPYMEPYGTVKEMGVSELWDLQSERTMLCKQYLEAWNATASKTESGKPIDAILLPVTPYSGAKKGTFRYCGYTSVFNALDWPAGVVPVTTADKTVDSKPDCYVPRNEMDKTTFDEFDPDMVDGGPVSIQVVCKKAQDEKVVSLMRHISEIIGTINYWTTKSALNI